MTKRTAFVARCRAMRRALDAPFEEDPAETFIEDGRDRAQKHRMPPALVADLPLQLYVRTALRNGGIKTVDDLLLFSDAELLRLPHLGKTGVAAIRAWREARGLEA